MANNTEHKKHPHLERPNMGEWGRNEYSIIGAPCDRNAEIASQLAKSIAGRAHLAYIDASHDNTSVTKEFDLVATRHTNFWQKEQKSAVNIYQSRLMCNDSDIQLINGNHFNASKQIVIIDQRKKESLSKKLDRLTNVSMVLVPDSDEDIYDFLTDLLPQDVLIIRDCEYDRIADKLLADFQSKDVIKGLILAGGRSQRMGYSKAKINYHGVNQVDYLYDQMSSYCDEVFVSLRPDQFDEFKASALYDNYMGFGPMGGILSAFKSDPNAAWLTIAIDMPFVNDQAIAHLITHRDKSKIASCFQRSDAQFPDPLFTIWEPKAYLHLLSFLSLGYSCPRKVLINNDVNIIQPQSDSILINVNDPQEMEAAKTIIDKK